MSMVAITHRPLQSKVSKTYGYARARGLWRECDA